VPELILPVPLCTRSDCASAAITRSSRLPAPSYRELSIPVDVHSCARVLATPPQAGLAQNERRRNLCGAFRVLRPLGAERVAILDDVVTTCNTVSELTGALLKAVVKRVDVRAVARRPDLRRIGSIGGDHKDRPYIPYSPRSGGEPCVRPDGFALISQQRDVSAGCLALIG